MEKKKLSYYLNLDYPVTVTKKYDEGVAYFEAEIPDLPGCATSGNTIEKSLISLEESKKLWLRTSLKRNLSIPEPVAEDEFSGKLLLRIPAKLHMKLSLSAKNVSLSLNQHIRTILESSLSIEDILVEMKNMKQNFIQLCWEVLELKTKIPVKPESADFTFSSVSKKAKLHEESESAAGNPNINSWIGPKIN